MSTLQVHLQGIGIYGPGLSGWSQTAGVLSGHHPWQHAPLQLPSIDALPAAERRRAGLPIKLAFAIGFEAIAQAGADAASLRTVFSSSAADGDNCHAILETLATTERAVSPTRFHNSVHNAPSGYWSIATACRAASTSLCAYDGSFAAGLLEAATQTQHTGEPCLLLAYDTPYPEPLARLRPITHALGVALLLSPRRTAGSLATLSLNLDGAAATHMTEAALESLRLGNPAARCLPLLQGLARKTAGETTLDYLDALTLHVAFQPLA
jgi:hypothetical protein